MCVSREYRIFLGTPIISGTGKATHFKFCTHFNTIDHNKMPLTISEKTERGRIHGLPKNFGEKEVWANPEAAQFFGYPLLSQEREKLRISNLAAILKASIRTKAS